MKNVYLVLAIVGGVVPYYFFFDFFSENGYALGTFIGGLFVNGAAGGFTADLLITSFVFWLFMFSRKDEGPNPLPFVVINLFIGLSCAFPLYLWWTADASEEAAG